MTSTEVMISDLVSRFGTDVTRKNLIDYAETSDVSFATVCNRLKDYKVGRGVYNLTVKEKLERTFNDLPAQEEQTLVPIKDVNYVPFGNFTDVKKIIKSGIFILLSSLVCLVTVKLFLSNKLVLNLVVN